MFLLISFTSVFTLSESAVYQAKNSQVNAKRNQLGNGS